MKKSAQLVTFSLIAAVSILVGMMLSGGIRLAPPTAAGPEMQPASLRQPAPAASPAEDLPVRQGLTSFADVVEEVNPAVVSIISTELVEPGRGNIPFHAPFEFFFGPDSRRRPERDEPRREDSGGSGFIISEDGYILTNFHVIEGADKIKVFLTDDDKEYRAEVVGTDPGTDLALIKINASYKLPAVAMGDSDRLRVGEWVIAVGNPYYYEHTVTVGVVSAKGRRLNEISRDPSLDEFIQTDAAINFGNSGGPLLNSAGEVIGVNSAISSVGQGIGFAVPINTAKTILPQLKASGHVSRGYLGVRLQNVTPDLRDGFGLKDTKGALVQDVERGLPGDKAGILPGDVIVGVDGEAVSTTDELVRNISARMPGTRVRLNLIRDGKPVAVTARLEDRGEHINTTRQARLQEDEEEGTQGERRLGITVDNITTDIRRQLNLRDGIVGVVVTDVSQVSEAYEQGIGRGYIITEVNRVPVSSVAEYRREMSKVRPGSKVLFRTYDANRNIWRFVVVGATEE